jgi:splicing factor 3B subunit 2
MKEEPTVKTRVERQPEPEKSISNKLKKVMNRITIFDLKMQSNRPDLVENWDVTAPDPVFLVKLK